MAISRSRGGLSRQFYKRIGKYYGQEEGWQFQPHHAEQVFEEWVKENKLSVVREQRLKGVRKDGKRIVAIVLEKAPTDETNAQVASAGGDGIEIEAKIFIDATYEGDLMAKAGVSYMVGRESVKSYGEPLNGIRAKTPQHQFLTQVDPYVKPGDPGSGLIPLIQSGDGGTPGEDDKRVQTYNFRLCLTKVRKKNRSARRVMTKKRECPPSGSMRPRIRKSPSTILPQDGYAPWRQTDITNNGPRSPTTSG